MNQVLTQSDALENVRTFLAHQLIPALHKLAASDGLDNEERTAILGVAAALCALPYLDPDANIQFEVDLYWEEVNWIGTLDIADSALKLRSTLCQLEGLKPELNFQWQHTALDVESKVGTVLHDPSHLWFWIDCFRRFVNGFSNSSTKQQATFKLVSRSANLDLQYGTIWADRESQ